MNNDIRPPKTVDQLRSQEPQPPLRPASQQPQQPANPANLPSIENLSGTDAPPLNTIKRTKKKLVVFVISILLAILVGTISIGLFLLSPKNASAEPVTVEIVSGMVPREIADELARQGVIRNSMAFLIYARASGNQNNLQAGTYQLSPGDSVPEIISKLQKGPDADEIEVMFKPGATLRENKQVLIALGYSEAEINAAFSKQYDHPLFQTRPAGMDLEGYIFGETHRFTKGTSVEVILQRYFDDFYAVVKDNDLVALYDKQGLSLYEGITLASIVQRESGGDDKAQIAQVFLLRLASSTPLGSDVTYQYIADKEGKPRDTQYDSPYNTRRYAGLPPGPIAVPGVAALKAVGTPAEGDYLYFLSGDDDVTYFARTLGEHEANIRNHCQKKCSIL